MVKLGGTTLAEQQQVFLEIAAVARHRPVVVVHGGGNGSPSGSSASACPAGSRAACG